MDLDEEEMENTLGVNLDRDIATCEVPFGGILFLNNAIPHRSLENYSNKIRWSLGSGGAVEVIKALCGSGVKQLLLWNTGIGEPDCEALCELLKSCHSLQRLHIAQNNLSSESVASIITGLSLNSCLLYTSPSPRD